MVGFLELDFGTYSIQKTDTLQRRSRVFFHSNVFVFESMNHLLNWCSVLNTGLVNDDLDQYWLKVIQFIWKYLYADPSNLDLI